MWEVQLLIGEQWENVWTVEDGEEKETFATRLEAQEALDEHLKDIAWAVKVGDMQDNGPDEYRIALCEEEDHDEQ